MTPTFLEAIGENSPMTLGLFITLIVLLAGAIASTLKGISVASATGKIAAKSAEKANEGLARVEAAMEKQGARFERQAEQIGIQVSQLVANTSGMAADIRHLTERTNGAPTRAEFDELKERVSRLDERIDGKVG